ncbi:MAG: serine protease [Pseudomonadota bacterium]
MGNRAGLILLTSSLLLVALGSCDRNPSSSQEKATTAAKTGGSSRSERCQARLEKDSGGRIVGGKPAKPGTAPWQIAIMSSPDYSQAERQFDAELEAGDECKNYLEEREEFELSHKCGGSYIGDGWIVTAAHCVDKVSAPDGSEGDAVNDRHLIMGTQNLTAADTKFALDAVVIHSGYSRSEKMDDIAVIKLGDDSRTRSRIAELIAQGRLAAIDVMRSSDRNFEDREDLRVTGWGYMGQRNANRDFQRLHDSQGELQRKPAALQQLTISYLDNALCEEHYRDIGAGSLCAGAIISDGSLGAGKDSCQGDSGGPLTRLDDGGKRTLVGIVSRGKGCGAPEIPAVYVRISHYVDWIEAAKQNAKPNSVTRWPEQAQN